MAKFACVVALAVAACSPEACNDADDRILAEVDVLVGESGSASRRAMLRLVARGPEAIAMLETGLARTNATGRRRIVRALVQIAGPESRAVLSHLGKRDPDPQVREAATTALDTLAAP